MTRVLGIDVSPDLLEHWRKWFAPALQPFPTEHLFGEVPVGRSHEPSDHVRDTFYLYGENPVWLEEHEFTRLSLSVRRTLLAGRKPVGNFNQLSSKAQARIGTDRTDSRVVWWPSVLRRVGDEPVLDYVRDGVRPSRHREVSPSTWAAARRLVPGAEELAGTYPSGSGPNCFGAVMAGAGVEGAAWERVVREPFEAWLATHTTPIRGTAHDGEPGVVLLWRTTEGLVDHAAVTIGDGYAFSKPSQAWCSPRLVWTVRETIAANQVTGLNLSRHRCFCAW